MNKYTRVNVTYIPGNKLSDMKEWDFPYNDDEFRLVEDFHSLDLSALSDAEKHRITQLILELPRHGVVRTDSMDPVLGLVIVALKRK